MDPDVMRWVLEFLLLQSSIPDTTIMRIMLALPISDTDSRLKKIILLRTIQSDLYKASITEKMLDWLEVLEELYRLDGISITESMKDAYCAVAMECTVKHLEVFPNGSVEYLDAVKRIWRDRFREMEDIGDRSVLVLKLNQWRDDIEAALWDSEVCERLADMNTRRDALKKVGAYLEEARRMIGTSFIELVARGIEAGNELVEVATEMPVKSCGIVVNDFDHSVEETNAGERMKRMISEPMSENEGMQIMVIEPMNRGEGGQKIISEPLEECEEMVSKPMNEFGMTFEARNEGGGIAAEPEKRRTGSSTDTRGDCSAKDRIELDSGAACREEASLTGGNQANKQAEERAVNLAGGTPMLEQVQPETREHCCAEDRIELDNGAACTEEAPVKGGSQVNEQVQKRAVNLAGGSDPPMREKTDGQKSNLQLKCKHVASHRQRGRVKITGAEEVGQMSSSVKYDCVPSPEVEEVRESLKSSLFELQALVKDPLPGALHISETVISELASKQMNHEPPLVKRSTDVDVSGSDNANPVNDGRPSLMERNNTAHTYEWDDSIDNLPEGTLNCASRFHLPSPKRDNKSPLKRYEAPKLTKRRKRKGWSVLEEDTLRAGVQKFGIGNWKLILNANRDIFEERTEVDLKDKWRNMTRY